MEQRQVNVVVNVETKNAKTNLKGVEKGLKDTQKQAVKTSDVINDQFSRMGGPLGGLINQVKSLGTSFKGIAVGVGVGAIAGITSLFVSATKRGAEFAKQMSTLEAVSGATNIEMEKMAESAKKLGASTQFTSIQVGELQTEFAKMGFTTDQILASTEATLALAASMEVGLASAATLAGSTVNAFGLQAEDTQRVVDVLAKSTSSSALDFSSLTEALKNAAPAAKATNRTVEETTALLGVLANNGIKGSRAGTALTATFIELNKKGITLEEALAEIGQSSNKLGTAIDLAGVLGGKALSTLAGKEKDIKRLTLSLENSAGAAQEMAEVRLDNLAGDTTKLSSAWEGFLLSIEDGTGIFNTIARGIVQATTALLNFITPTEKLSESLEKERTELFKVQAELGNVNTSQERRTNLILELQKKYPEYLKNIDAETASNEDLNKAIQKINKSLINKILIQEKEEEIQEQAEETADELNNVLEKEANLLEYTAELRKKYSDLGFEIKANSPNEVLNELNDIIDKQNNLRLEGNDQNKLNTKLISEGRTEIRRLEQRLKSLNNAEQDYQKELEKGNKFIEEKNALMERLGIKTEEATESTEDGNDASGEAVDIERDLIKLLEKELELAQQMPATTRREVAARNDKINAINAEIKALKELSLIKSDADKFAEMEIPKMQTRNLQQIDMTKFRANTLKNIETTAAQQTADEVIRNEVRIGAEKTRLNEEEEQRIINNQIRNQQRMMQQMDFTARTLGAIIQLSQSLAKDDEASQRKAFKTRKAAGIAQGIINTGLAVTAALTAGGNPIKLATGAQFVEAGIAAITGAAQVATIARQKFESTSSTVPSVGGTEGGLGGGVTETQAPQFNIVGQSGFNQIASALGQQQPVQAFVVAQDVTTAQQLNNNIISAATVGG